MGFNQPSYFLQGHGTNAGVRHAAHVDLLGKVTCIGFNQPRYFLQGAYRNAPRTSVGYDGVRSPFDGYQRPKNWAKMKWHPGKGLYGDAHVYGGGKYAAPWWPGGGRWMVRGESDDNAAHIRWWKQWENVEHMLGDSEGAGESYYNLFYNQPNEYVPSEGEQPPSQREGAASHFLMGNSMQGSWQEDEAELTGETVSMGGNTEPAGHGPFQISERAFFHGDQMPVTAWSLHQNKHANDGWSVSGEEQLPSDDGLSAGARESYYARYNPAAAVEGASPRGDGPTDGANESYWSKFNNRVDNGDDESTDGADGSYRNETNNVGGVRNARRRRNRATRLGNVLASPGGQRPDGGGLSPGAYFMSGYGAVSVPRVWLSGAIADTGLPANLSPEQAARVLTAMVKAEDPRVADVIERLAEDSQTTKHPFSIATLNALCQNCEGTVVMGFVPWSQIAHTLTNKIKSAVVRVKSGSKRISHALTKAVKTLTHSAVSKHLPIARANARKVVPNTGTALALAIKKADIPAPRISGGGDANGSSPFPVNLTPAQAGKVLANLVSSQDKRAANIVRQTAAKSATGNHASTAILIAMMHHLAGQSVPAGATVAMGSFFDDIASVASLVVSTVKSAVSMVSSPASSAAPGAAPSAAMPGAVAAPAAAPSGGGLFDTIKDIGATVTGAISSAVKMASGVVSSLPPQHTAAAAAGVNVPIPNAGAQLNAALNGASTVKDPASAQAAVNAFAPSSSGPSQAITVRPHGDEAQSDLTNRQADVIVLEMPKQQPWYAMSRYR